VIFLNKGHAREAIQRPINPIEAIQRPINHIEPIQRPIKFSFAKLFITPLHIAYMKVGKYTFRVLFRKTSGNHCFMKTLVSFRLG
jgi:hypothetical protein